MAQITPHGDRGLISTLAYYTIMAMNSTSGRRDHHERLKSGEPIEGSSNRIFGIVFSVVFTVIGLLPMVFGGDPRTWALVVAAGLLVVAIVIPGVLAPLNWVWRKVSLVLHRIFTVVAMAALFYGVVTPTGVVARLLGKDLLRLRSDRSAASYWILREPPGPDAKTMQNQF